MALKIDAKFEGELTCASKMTWAVWKTFTRALKVSKLQLWLDSFIQSIKRMSLKFTEELCVMTMKNDAKLEE